MATHDDDLSRFAAEGAPALSTAAAEGYVDHDGARIWYAVFGGGPPAILLHGGLGHGGNWGYQVPALVAAGYRPIVIDKGVRLRPIGEMRPGATWSAAPAGASDRACSASADSQRRLVSPHQVVGGTVGAEGWQRGAMARRTDGGR